MFVAWAPFYSGAERALLVLVENLDRSKYRPIVVVGTDGELADELRSRQIRMVHQPVIYFGARTLPSWAACVTKLVLLARSERVRVIHSNDVPSFQPAGYAAKIVGVPALTHVRFPDTRAGFSWFLKPGFAKALFVSGSLRAEALQEAPALFAGARSEVLYDGVDVPPLGTGDERAQLRQELGLPLDATLVVMAGQVAEVKGIWDFIEAAQLLVQRRVPVSLVVLGDDLKNKGAVRLQAEQLVKDRGLSAHVTFLGFRPNAQRLIPAFDIVAVPSHVEPLGLSALEGMAAARPVIGSRVGGIVETVVDGVTGTLVPSKDPARLAAAIEWLADNPGKADAFGRAGRERVMARFGIDAHVTAVQAVYDRMLCASASTEETTVGGHSQ